MERKILLMANLWMRFFAFSLFLSSLSLSFLKRKKKRKRGGGEKRQKWKAWKISTDPWKKRANSWMK